MDQKKLCIWTLFTQCGGNELNLAYILTDPIVDNSNIYAAKLMAGCEFTRITPLFK